MGEETWLMISADPEVTFQKFGTAIKTDKRKQVSCKNENSKKGEKDDLSIGCAGRSLYRGDVSFPRKRQGHNAWVPPNRRRKGRGKKGRVGGKRKRSATNFGRADGFLTNDG